MGCCRMITICLIICLTGSFLIPGTHQLQSSQTQVLLQLKKHLGYPQVLEIWQEHGTDFCSLPWSENLNITCQNNFITELRVVGNKVVSKTSTRFNGVAIPNETLSETFSMDSFVATLARLTSLRVVSLVSLGIWGPLPDKIHRLSSLEYLDLSSNFLFGSIPPKISTMLKLQTLLLDDNFFKGTVPGWLNSLPNLTSLSLKNNQLSGPLPSSIQQIQTLIDLDLSGNELSGKLPDLSGLHSLNVLDLSGNRLDHELPAMPYGLVTASLNNNSFSGEIPQQYGKLTSLQHLDVSFNRLDGTAPGKLFSLPNVSYLNLGSNQLSGSLPGHLECGKKLAFVDLSGNRLVGALPSCLSSNSDQKVVKFRGNCLSINQQHQHPESYCSASDIETESKQSRGREIGILVGVVVGIFVLMVLLAVGLVAVCRLYCTRGISEQHLLHKSVAENSATGFTSEVLTSARFISEASKLGTEGFPACRSFSVEELKDATKNFDNLALLGESSFGKLYKGRLENGTRVAIRCLPSSKKYTIRNLKLRLDLLSRLRHPHLVCLLGHCIDTGGKDEFSVNKVFLVYEYLPNGNFRTHLSENSLGKVLNWSERLQVLIGVAKAIHFLHTGVIPGFFNNKLNTNKILLNEHHMAKLSDYGLSIVSEETNNHGGGKGESDKSWQMTTLEDDVYSFGIVILESLVGPSVSGRKEASVLNDFASFSSQDGRGHIVDPTVLTTCSQESLSIVISIMNKCTCPDSSNRPSLEDVLWNLQYAAQVQATTDGTDPKI